VFLIACALVKKIHDCKSIAIANFILFMFTIKIIVKKSAAENF
jgi:hypothetical protein